MTIVGIVGDQHLRETPPRSRKDDYLAQCLAELEFVVLSCDVTICLGDVLHKISLNDEATNRILDKLNEWRAKGKVVYTIVGNHDIRNMNLATLEQGTLRIFSEANLLPIISELKVEGVGFVEIPLKNFPTVPVAGPGEKVLLGHFFYDQSLDPKMSITPEQLEGCGFQYVFLGHDHEPHPPLTLGKSTLFRAGSLCRDTSHAYHLVRQPHFMRLVIDGDEVTKVEMVEVAAPRPDEIFFPDAFKKVSTNSMAFVDNINDLLNQFLQVSSRQSQFTIKSALTELGAPDYVVSYIASIHVRQGMNFA